MIYSNAETPAPRALYEKIVCSEELAPSVFRLRVASEYVSGRAAPGQFAAVLCGEGDAHVLRRPISICDYDRAAGHFDLVFQVRGEGTATLSRLSAGENIDVLAPLGKGYDTDSRYKSIAVVGGGLGVFPLLGLLRHSSAEKKSAFLGFRDKGSAVLMPEFESVSDLHIATDDGSLGEKGFVTGLLEAALKSGGYDIVYICGPTQMMRAAAALAEAAGIACEVSLEQRMACGVGACLGCACKTRGADGGEKYLHVCKNGPVFKSSDVVWRD